MLPPGEALPDVLPTSRLTASGRPVPEVRASLRRIPNLANALTVVSCWAWTIGPIWLAARVDHPVLWVAAFLLVGRSFARLNILGHEAAHRLLFTDKAWNDRVGRWLLSHPAFTPLDAYRRAHMAHHKDEMGPEEPDLALYAGYPITKASMRRKLVRDAVGISGWKNLKGLLRGIRARNPIALKILAAQAVVFAGFLAWGRPELYLLLWLAPWLTVWRVLNRLRAIAEHGGMARSPDRRLTTHHVRQSLLARFWMVPYNTGWHLAHHVDIGIPWRSLPALHDELVASGWVAPDLEYPSYLALWRQLASRPAETPQPATA
jgi:fatty acid desaturase